MAPLLPLHKGRMRSQAPCVHRCKRVAISMQGLAKAPRLCSRGRSNLGLFLAHSWAGFARGKRKFTDLLTDQPKRESLWEFLLQQVGSCGGGVSSSSPPRARGEYAGDQLWTQGAGLSDATAAASQLRSSKKPANSASLPVFLKRKLVGGGDGVLGEIRNPGSGSDRNPCLC